MQDTTPPGDSARDSRNDLRGRHGDVDRNGDLVDAVRREVDRVKLETAGREERLVGAICAPSTDLAVDQLRAVKQLLRPWTVKA